MLHHRHCTTATDPTRGATPTPSGRDPTETAQLRRLAGALLTKSPEDLAALAANNPALIWEWRDAFRKEKLAAEEDMRFWLRALAVLAIVEPQSFSGSFPAAAE